MWVLGFGVMVGMASLVVPQLLRRSATVSFDVERQFEAQLLATNLRELAKYLILYEKSFYTGQAPGFMGTGRPPTQVDEDLVELWGQTFTKVVAANASLLEACGGYSPRMEYMGTHRVAGVPVFCPFYFRSNLFSGLMAEKMLFELWASNAPVVTRVDGRVGTYQLELDFTRALEPGSDRIASLDSRSKILREMLRAFDNDDIKAKVTVTFSTESGGFRSIAAERFIHFHSEVTFLGARGNQRYVEDSETIMMALATPKEFAIFIPYPTAATNDLRANFVIPPNVTVDVFGRTFFNGDIDFGGDDVGEAIGALPTFHDAVIISGTFRPTVPGPEHLDRLRRKFRKGIVTNYSAHRFLFSGSYDNTGACLNGGGGTSIENQMEFTCHMDPLPVGANACTGPANLMEKHMIDRSLNPECFRGTIVAQSVGNRTTLVYQDPPITPCMPAGQFNPNDCRETDPANASVDENLRQGEWSSAIPGGISAMIHRGFRGVEVRDVPYIRIVSPVQSLRVTSAQPVSIYGLVMGGRIEIAAGDTVTFRSLTAVRPGLPGIPDDAAVGQLNNDAARASTGTSVSLVNLPVIYSSKEGLR